VLPVHKAFRGKNNSLGNVTHKREIKVTIWPLYQKRQIMQRSPDERRNNAIFVIAKVAINV
jgi:hypothetical protein